MSEISCKLVFVPQKANSMVAKFTDFPNFRLKYLENQESYFNQKGLNHVLGFLKTFHMRSTYISGLFPL